MFSEKLFSPEDPNFKYLHETEGGCNEKFFSLISAAGIFQCKITNSTGLGDLYLETKII